MAGGDSQKDTSPDAPKTMGWMKIRVGVKAAKLLSDKDIKANSSSVVGNREPQNPHGRRGSESSVVSAASTQVNKDSLRPEGSRRNSHAHGTSTPDSYDDADAGSKRRGSGASQRDLSLGIVPKLKEERLGRTGSGSQRGLMSPAGQLSPMPQKGRLDPLKSSKDVLAELREEVNGLHHRSSRNLLAKDDYHQKSAKNLLHGQHVKSSKNLFAQKKLQRPNCQTN